MDFETGRRELEMVSEAFERALHLVQPICVFADLELVQWTT